LLNVYLSVIVSKRTDGFSDRQATNGWLRWLSDTVGIVYAVVSKDPDGLHDRLQTTTSRYEIVYVIVNKRMDSLRDRSETSAEFT
jgi:hypothetical protein